MRLLVPVGERGLMLGCEGVGRVLDLRRLWRSDGVIGDICVLMLKIQLVVDRCCVQRR